MKSLSRAKRLASRIFHLVPESPVKDQLRCLAYNRMQSMFRISKQAGWFLVEKDGLSMKFEENPYHLFVTDADYLRDQAPRAGDTVVDAGAFIGVFSVYAALKVGPRGHVFALEPDPGTLPKLKRHLELNGVQNVTIVPKGLWSSETTLRFELGKELASAFVEASGTGGATVEVPVTTLDAILQSASVNGDIFVKMNIEGSEIEALRGAVETIEQHHPYWVIRTNHIVDGNTTDRPVETFLRARGYVATTSPLHELTTFARYV